MNTESRELLQSVEEAEWRQQTSAWSLKVRYERDVAEQALSLCYTAGSVTTVCSPTPLPSSLSPPLCSITPRSRSPSQMSFSLLICFSLSPLSPPVTFFLRLSDFISFYILPSLSGLLCEALLLLPDTAAVIHHKTVELKH